MKAINISETVCRELFRRAAVDAASVGKLTKSRLGFLLCSFLDGREEDTACAVFFSGRMKFLGISLTDISYAHLCDVIDTLAAGYGAKYFVIAHTHAGNPVVPSNEDLTTTEILKKRYSDGSLKFLDHYIVSDYDYMSILSRDRRDYRTRKDRI